MKKNILLVLAAVVFIFGASFIKPVLQTSEAYDPIPGVPDCPEGTVPTNYLWCVEVPIIGETCFVYKTTCEPIREGGM